MSSNEASPRLDEADLALFRDLGTQRRVAQGEYLYRQGDLTYDFYVAVTAEVDIVLTVDGGERLVVRQGGLRVLVSARVAKAGEVIMVPRDRLRHVMATERAPGRHHPRVVHRSPQHPHEGGGSRDPGDRLALLAGVAEGA